MTLQLYSVGETLGEIPQPTVLTREELSLKESLKNLDTTSPVYDDARKSCSHRAFFDTAGFLYDIRTCGVCNGSLGLI